MTDEQRAIELTGHTVANLAEAVDQWEREREALAELYDENQAFEIMFRRFDVAMSLAERILGKVESEAGMFIGQDVRDQIAKFREQVAMVMESREHGRELVLLAKTRKVPA